MIDKIFKIIKKITPTKWHWIFSHEGYRRYFTNTGWMFGGQLFSFIIAFFVGAWLARYLGPQNYGILSYVIAFVGIFGFVSSLGIDGILNRELIKFPEKRDELLGTAFRLKLIGGTLASILAIIGVVIFQADPLIRLLIVLFSLSLVLQSINVINIYFQAEVKSKNNVKVQVVSIAISSVFKICAILLGGGLISIIVIYTLDFIWQGIGFVNTYKNVGLKIKNWQFNKDLAQNILNNSWPLMLASGASFIYLKIDQVMIGAFLDNREVGIYAVAVRLSEVWYFIPGIICSSIFPAIINAKRTDLNIYKRRLKSFFTLMTIIPIIIVIPMVFFAKPIVHILFGDLYIESVDILRVYILSSFGLFLSFAVNQYLISEDLIKTIFWLNFFAMLVNIILNLIFIPIFGLVGAAWVTFFTYSIVPIGAWILKS